MKILIVFILIAGLFTIVLPQTIVAQWPAATSADIAVQIIEARKANAALMCQYSWKSRTAVVQEGKGKSKHIDAVSYGPDGQLKRTPLHDEGLSERRGGLLGLARDEIERKKMEDYVAGLRSLLDQYTLPTVDKVLDFINQATTTGPDASGLLVMTGTSVVLPGDSLSLWASATTRHTQRVVASTFYKGDAVKVTATFNTFYSGLNYMAYAEVEIPARDLKVHVQNDDFQRTEGSDVK